MVILGSQASQELERTQCYSDPKYKRCVTLPADQSINLLDFYYDSCMSLPLPESQLQLVIALYFCWLKTGERSNRAKFTSNIYTLRIPNGQQKQFYPFYTVWMSARTTSGKAWMMMHDGSRCRILFAAKNTDSKMASLPFTVLVLRPGILMNAVGKAQEPLIKPGPCRTGSVFTAA